MYRRGARLLQSRSVRNRSGRTAPWRRPATDPAAIQTLTAHVKCTAPAHLGAVVVLLPFGHFACTARSPQGGTMYKRPGGRLPCALAVGALMITPARSSGQLSPTTHRRPASLGRVKN